MDCQLRSTQFSFRDGARADDVWRSSQRGFRCLVSSEFEIDPDEWSKLSHEDKGIRLLEGGKKLVQADYNFYDAELKKFIIKDWQKASKVIHHFLSKAKNTTGDAYLLWRLKNIIADGEYDVQGKIASMKDFEIKQKSIVTEPTE